MPDTIRKIDYYYFTAPDKAGEGARIFSALRDAGVNLLAVHAFPSARRSQIDVVPADAVAFLAAAKSAGLRSEEHTSELQSLAYLVCRLLLEKKNRTNMQRSAARAV